MRFQLVQAGIIVTACMLLECLFYIRQKRGLEPTQTLVKSSMCAMSKTHELLFKKA